MAIAVPVLLVVADTGLWVYGCSRIESAARTLAASGGPADWTATLGASRWDGWPFATEVRFAPAVVHGGKLTMPPNLQWRTEVLRLRIGIVHPTVLVAAAEGQQSVAAPDTPPVLVNAQIAHASFDLDQHDPVRVTLRAVQAVVPAGPFGLEAGDLTIWSDRANANLTGISLPALYGRAPLPSIDALQATAAVTRPFGSESTPAAAARAWRDAGGQIELNPVALRWGKLAATGQGTVGLDADLQPDADGSVEASGLPDLLDDLVRAGAVTAPAGSAVKAVVAVLAAPSGGRTVRLPVALAGGVLSVARYPLLRISKLTWP